METKIIFMGTPEFSVPILKALIEKYNVIAVVTQPDRIRGNKTVISKIKEVALENNIKVLQPERIRKEYEEIVSLHPDMIVTCAYGQIIPKELLDAPKYGCINVHASLLPKLRGGAPIHHAIIDGYKETGITIMYMNEKMDEGDIIIQKSTIISDEDTVSSLHDRLSLMGTELIIETIPKIINNEITRIKQNDENATYAYTIKREDEKIDFNKTAREVFNQIRGLNSFPGSYCIYKNKILKVYESKINENNQPGEIGEIINLYDDGFGVKVKDGEIILTLVQLEGKNKVTGSSFINGHKNELLNEILK